MSFNPDPNKQSVEMLFSRKRSEQNHPPLFFNNVLVASASDHKHLGIILDCKLLLTKHISEKVAKARKGIGIIRHLSFHVPLDVLGQLYKLFVRPLLDYCDIMFRVPAITTHLILPSALSTPCNPLKVLNIKQLLPYLELGKVPTLLNCTRNLAGSL